MIKKNIILTSADAENFPSLKGIANIETDNNNTYINLKTYNFNKNFGKLLFGLKQNADFYKIEVSDTSSSKFKIEKPINLNDKISCVLIGVNNNTATPLIWGSNETNKVWQNSFLFNADENANLKNTEENSTDFENGEEFEDYESDEEIEKIVDTSIKNLNIETEPEQNNFEAEPEDSFYGSIKNQVEDLLNNYENEKALEEIIPNSKFVKVDYEKNGEYYIFGVIYEAEKIRYIVYGLPGEFDVKPNDDYSAFYQWLPLDSENPEGYGYYLMYQDAENGEAIKIEII